jgi:FKBP-type peptidyl-prolyl cis-trans isomerase FklB
MKRLFIAATAALTLFASCEKTPTVVTTDFSSDSTELATFNDSLSFVIGTFMANQTLKSMSPEVWVDGTINREAFFVGFNKFIKDKDSGIDQPTMKALLAIFGKQQQEQAMAKAKEEEQKLIDNMSPIDAEIKARNEQYLVHNKEAGGFEVTATGLQYRVISKGDGPTPTAASVVKVHYTGKTIEGKVFDSSVDRGEPATFPVNQVIAGWTEALQFMPVGSKYELVIPQELAYGPRGAGGAIGPYSTLVFEVELLEIMPPQQGGGHQRR